MSVDLNQIAEDFKKQKNELMEKVQAKVYEAFKDIFDSYPDITRIEWTQIIPYFNDGETCEFRIHDWYVKTTPEVHLEENLEENLEILEENLEDQIEENLEDQIEENLEILEELYYEDDSGVLSSWDDDDKTYIKIWNLEKFASTEIGLDVFESAFGSHAKVSVNREGIEVEEYVDHD